MTKPTDPAITPEDARIAGDVLGELARKMRDDAVTVGDFRRAEGLAGVAAYLTSTAAAFADANLTPTNSGEKMAAIAHAQAIHRGRSHEDAIAIALGALLWLANTSPQPGPTTSQILGVVINSLEIARSRCHAAAQRASA